MSRPLSISSRLFLASICLLPIFLGATGLVLERAFQRSLTTAAEERLQSHVYLLLSVAELEQTAEGATLDMPEALLEPEFERVNSGLYAIIESPTGDRPIWQSSSARLLSSMPSPSAPPAEPGRLAMDEVQLQDQPHWRARYAVIWEDDSGAEHPFQITLLRDQSAYRAELASYRSQLWRWLGAAALVLLLTQSAILRWGLRPLPKLAQALDAMRRGETGHIRGQHPRELQPIVDNLNQVLQREQALRQRYRESLSNLAHSLKTPLSVLRSHAEDSSERRQTDDPLHQVVSDQVDRMDQVVNYQLKRAVSEQQQGLHRQAPIRPAAERLIQTLNKVYRDKPIDAELALAPEVRFPGDEQDLLELLGNLLDNAYKYGRARVRLSARGGGNTLVLQVDDDGPGVPEAERERVLQRGQRLDSLQPGQGIGLAVAADIVRSYGGQLSLERSELGGAGVKAEFGAGSAPAAME